MRILTCNIITGLNIFLDKPDYYDDVNAFADKIYAGGGLIPEKFSERELEKLEEAGWKFDKENTGWYIEV